jgi:hypothetical protein
LATTYFQGNLEFKQLGYQLDSFMCTYLNPWNDSNNYLRCEIQYIFHLQPFEVYFLSTPYILNEEQVKWRENNVGIALGRPSSY